MSTYAEPQQKRAAKPVASGEALSARRTRALPRRADASPLSGEQQALQDAYDLSPRAQAQRNLDLSLNGGPRAAERARLAASLSRAPHTAAVQRREDGDGDDNGSLVTTSKCASVARCGEEDDDGEFKPMPVQRQSESAGAAAGAGQGGAGLPAGLRDGVEALAGVPMGDVEVEYNSPEPAKVNALATTQGRRIRLAPGRERDLPHEAWHAAQQKQGRVRATAQLNNTPLNDDAALEREADQMGARAEREGGRVLQGKAGGGGLSAPASSAAESAPLQRLLKKDEADVVATPASAIMKSFKVNKNQLSGFTDKVPATPTERAKKVSATVDKKTLRPGKRKDKKGPLGKVTGMARAEQLILQGADMLKFYDAGHLVADQLVDGDPGTDSFVLWNLAPQVSTLNEHTYTNVMEEEIKEAAEKNAAINLRVRLAYPSDHYTVKRREIVRRGILPAKPLDTPTTKWDIAGKEFKDSDLDADIDIPRRVPNVWKLTADITTPVMEFPKKEKEAAKGKPAEKFAPDLNVPQAQPTIGDPYRFLVKGATLANEKLTLAASEKRSFKSRQWGPSATGVPNEDIISLVRSTFADIESGKIILERLKGTDILVAVQQKDALLSAVTETLNPQKELTDLALGLAGLLREFLSLRDGFDSSALTLSELSDALPGKAQAADEYRQISEAMAAIRKAAEELEGEVREVSEAYPPRIEGFLQAAALAQDPADIFKSVFNAQTAAHELEKDEVAPLKEELKTLSDEVAALDARLTALGDTLRRLKEEAERLAREEEERRQLASAAASSEEEEEEEQLQSDDDWLLEAFLTDFSGTETTTTTLSATATQPTPQYDPGGPSGSVFDLPGPSGTTTTGGPPSSSNLKRSREILEQDEQVASSSQQSDKRHLSQSGSSVMPTGRTVDLTQMGVVLGTSEGGNYVRVERTSMTPPAWPGDNIHLGFMVVTVKRVAAEDGFFYLYY